MQNNVFGVYRPHRGEEMMITCEWPHEDSAYLISVVGADIELIVDDPDVESPQEAFNLAEEDIARELTRYSLSYP